MTALRGHLDGDVDGDGDMDGEGWVCRCVLFIIYLPESAAYEGEANTCRWRPQVQPQKWRKFCLANALLYNNYMHLKSGFGLEIRG